MTCREAYLGSTADSRGSGHGQYAVTQTPTSASHKSSDKCMQVSRSAPTRPNAVFGNPSTASKIFELCKLRCLRRLAAAPWRRCAPACPRCRRRSRLSRSTDTTRCDGGIDPKCSSGNSDARCACMIADAQEIKVLRSCPAVTASRVPPAHGVPGRYAPADPSGPGQSLPMPRERDIEKLEVKKRTNTAEALKEGRETLSEWRHGVLTALTHSASMLATMAHLQPTVGVNMGQKGLLFWVHRLTCKQSVPPPPPPGWQARSRKSRHRYKVRT